ncbi:chain length determinant protein (polysaccharide antigen chain regulator) [Rahnella sp. BIGb0236]|uniref:LPS O-antigen chain length determinant protein WzzB n=1 Tax=Rahnella sp. BIGb0236 TaxID=2485117 RepID=UPI001061AF55|nr:LPS O-antigen chain length determinant protein WzzB [Rahnella sp. BIGb0236]TDS88343.1 chain length determinant protein (polysaccharide antigen chain regulator) [Rahnella sp. BIGb0236]VTQ62342.1 Polysaccharide antigen chain regulator [Campylobacter jejuni]
MNQDNTFLKPPAKNSAEDIDFFDIILQLWRGKIIIALFAFLMIIIAVGYLFIAKEKWTSEAIVTYPDSGQIANYNNAMAILYSQNPANAPSIVDVQQRFFSRFNSAIAALSEQLDNQEIPEKLVILPAVKGQEFPLRISYTGDSAGAARKTLTTYIQQINKRVVTELEDDLQSSVTSKIKDLNERLDSQVKVAQERKDKRLQILNQALVIAEQSHIKDTRVQQAETLSEDTLFVLGSDALAATIKNESTRPLPLDDDYYNTRQALIAISSLKSNPETTYALRYVMKPNMPIHRDSPKKALTLIIGALFGVILGAAFVLGRNAIRKYNESA